MKVRFCDGLHLAGKGLAGTDIALIRNMQTNNETLAPDCVTR